MRDVTDDLKEQLEDDLLYHAWIVQCVADYSEDTGVPRHWEDVLRDMLADGIEIGDARIARPDYVEFVAWTGSLDERMARAVACVESAPSNDAAFAYWLCLAQNVDRYEDGA